MKLTLQPVTKTPQSTISRLFLDGVFECYVLEPPDPIPSGIFSIALLPSLKFGRVMPFLQGIPGHTAVEIHWGNTAADTRDCLLVGQTVGTDFIGKSRPAFEALFAKLSAATDPITVEVTRGALPTPATQLIGDSMQVIDTWFNSPRGHAIGMLVCTVLAQLYPQYASALQGVAYAFGYGAVVAGAAPKP